jgi:mannose-6-phosphate isomerase
MAIDVPGLNPVVLPANQPRSFYRGAGRIARFRAGPAAPDPGGSAAPDPDYYPEDWIASVTARFGTSATGLTVLPDGRSLRAAVAGDPVGWLGAEHVARHGADPAVLVKLLDAGQRLPLHVHPDRSFARAHLASAYGKTEAWVVIAAEPGAAVHLGFARPVPAAELAGWVQRQDVPAMLAATNRVPVRAGDTVGCPAGVPHAIGAGILVAELQEPTDFSVLLEWDGFAIDGAADGHLGLGFDVALRCVDRSAWPPDRLATLRGDTATGRPVRPGVTRLLPAATDGFFRAEWVRPAPAADLDASFAVLLILAGSGDLVAADGSRTPVSRGATILIPHGAGPLSLAGTLTAVRCLPPAAR